MPKNKKKLKKDFVMIGVYPVVHQKVSEIAERERMSRGDLVAQWATEHCDHPTEKREVFEAVYFRPSNGMENSRPMRGYFCNACRRYVITEAAPFVTA